MNSGSAAIREAAARYPCLPVVNELLPVEAGHVLALTDVPTHHNDPFDRLLVAQAHVEQATLVSVDKALHAYRDHVEILW